MILKRNKDRQPSLFISIGAGINQIPIILEAQKLGYQTIGVDKSTVAPGILKCDIRIQESIENYDEIYKKISELLLDGEIKGVLSKSFGPAIKTASYISERLKIPLIPFNRCDDFIDKRRMKKVFKENSILSPGFSIIRSKDAKTSKKISYPAIIKPVTGHAKTGVKLLGSHFELDKYLNNESPQKDCIIENYVEGGEIIAVGIIHKGIYHLVEITDKITTPKPYFVDIMHVSPSRYIHLQDKVRSIGQSIVNAFEIVTSPLVMELVITKNEEIYVIEAAPEFGGEFISDILIPARTGYNVLRETIRAVADNKFTLPAKLNAKRGAVVKYITGNNGSLSSFNPVPQNMKGIIFSTIFKHIGSKIKTPSTNHDRIGVIITAGKTVDEAKRIAETAERGLNIRIT